MRLRLDHQQVNALSHAVPHLLWARAWPGGLHFDNGSQGNVCSSDCMCLKMLIGCSRSSHLLLWQPTLHSATAVRCMIESWVCQQVPGMVCSASLVIKTASRRAAELLHSGRNLTLCWALSASSSCMWTCNNVSIWDISSSGFKWTELNNSCRFWWEKSV